jgi:hypothetical protein
MTPTTNLQNPQNPSTSFEGFEGVRASATLKAVPSFDGSLNKAGSSRCHYGHPERAIGWALYMSYVAPENLLNHLWTCKSNSFECMALSSAKA